MHPLINGPQLGVGTPRSLASSCLKTSPRPIESWRARNRPAGPWSPFTANHRTAGELDCTDLVRLKDGILLKHRDVIQDETAQQKSESGNPVFGDSLPK